ncbi:DNA primase [Streptomyces daghestanicus]|uniref:DNA primase n=1 Tax=Streptomyces daghestanicus TaxID=66885 RepID=A0ABQ3PXK3_9ACTN|nr:DNA primase [Streptomyces daghestanicus]GGU32356.1 hypothetical protein GCM10010259_23660 [Streptomyces daghestanicus]GHI29713.1 hypothetical protein Sdagh_14430 [Streptomyces daghestanicus]GHI29748.1 hypothetical protein Sdagh_14780 [Streptomyces daghestanicus]GHI32069.1 hypothetical protein Sdagh_37990 [Streptomyces daghestanicus]GHI32768.1 hypothetical protein Sdagh_44980 [Streptomyces daghestanicus]
MNRVGLGLAVGAGYFLGRTKKLKLAIAVGTAVAGKRMNLTPRGIADLVSTQLQNNPQFKEIGDQLRQDLRGVGKAATGAMVERQLDGLASRLQDRTSQVRDQLSGAASRVPGTGEDDRDDRDDRDGYDEDASDDADDDRDDRDEPERDAAPRRARTAKKAPAKKAPAGEGAAGKTAARKTAAKKTAGKKAAPARKTAEKTTQAARRTARGGSPKGGGER